MARIFITGSADGLGQLAAKELIKLGHQVVLHARNAERRKYALQKVPGPADVLIADLSSIDETKTLAVRANALGKFDAIIHNAGIYKVSPSVPGRDGLPLLFAVNTIAPYILTCLIEKPKRLIYLSSGMHLYGDPDLNNLTLLAEAKNSRVTYSDTKLHDVILAMIVAREWTNVYSNAVNPGWVPTKMGGAGAPDDLQKGFETQVWLAVSNDPAACVSGRYFFHKREAHYLQTAKDTIIQERFIALCQQITGIQFPIQNG
jgi:NAD(P)-dependent dehydrogenase (short-subunit alcohol dehydrogenase family)